MKKIYPALLFTLALCLAPFSMAQVSLWPSTTVPAVPDNIDTRPAELGVQFKSDVAGKITALRFYKGAHNTGTHTGHLWSSTGTLLASATFTSETATGWQQVTLSTPIAISANTIYVASYFSPTGNFSYTRPYFTVSWDTPPLHAPASTTTLLNGVYAYGATSTFPSSSFQQSNYYADIVFVSGPQFPTSVTTTVGPVGITLTCGSTGSVTLGPLTFTCNAIGPAHNVLVAWTASTSVVVGYNVYRSTTSGTGYAKINTSLISALNYTDGNVQSGTTYFYVATAVDSSGAESAFSNQGTAVIP